MTCLVCGQRIPEPGGYRYYCCCSDACTATLKARVEALARQQQPHLYDAKDRGNELILDPEVGDELAIARCSLESRLHADMTRQWRHDRMRASCAPLGLSDLAWGLLLLAERAAGCNWADVEIGGQHYEAYQAGALKPMARASAYRWQRVAGGWQEVRPDDDPYTRRRLADDELRPPRYGDIEGASALSWPEHGG